MTESELSQKDRALLTQYGALLRKGGFILSKDLLPDCELRSQIARFLTHVLHGHPSEEDRQVARNHPKLVGKVLRRIWPAIADSPAMPSDGDLRGSKWDLLGEPSVDVSAVSKIVAQEIRRSYLGSDAAWLLLHRSVPGVLHLARSKLKATSASPLEKLYAIAILSQYSHADLRPELGKIRKSSDLTRYHQTAIEKLETKMAAGEKADWSDVASLTDVDGEI